MIFSYNNQMTRIELLEPSIINIKTNTESYLAYVSAKNTFEMATALDHALTQPICALFVDDESDEDHKLHIVNKQKIKSAEPRQILTLGGEMKTIEAGTSCRLPVGTPLKMNSRCGHILVALDVTIL